MAYSAKTWGYLDTYTESDANDIENAMETYSTSADLNAIFNMFNKVGYYKVTEFDTPTAGDITESIKLTADDSTYATLVTEFDTPTSGDITVTLVCSDLGINRKIVTEFDTPTAGDIKETCSEVV